MAAIKGPWLPSPSLAWMPAKIWGAKKVIPLTPDHCLHVHATDQHTEDARVREKEEEGRERKGFGVCAAVLLRLPAEVLVWVF